MSRLLTFQKVLIGLAFGSNDYIEQKGQGIKKKKKKKEGYPDELGLPGVVIHSNHSESDRLKIIIQYVHVIHDYVDACLASCTQWGN